MQTNRKKIGILIILFGLILLALVIYFAFFRQSATTPLENPAVTSDQPRLETEPAVGTTTPSDKPRNRQTYDISQEAAHQTNASDLVKLAMAFSERFGSFSSQSDYGNFNDLKMFMTDSLKDWVDSYVQKLKSEKKSDAYYGIVTRALTADVQSFDEGAGTADIMVKTERSESTEGINGGQAYQQSLEIKFKKVGSDWLVDAVYWQK